MSESRSSDLPAALLLAAGADRFGEQRGLGISTIAFKVTPPNPVDPLILENTFLAKGGPARHLHTGESLLAPRQVPHVWAFVGEARGRILIAFLPAGKMEAFFREVTRANAMPPQDPALWRAHGMELLRPPLPVA